MAELTKEFPETTFELIPSGGGRFEVLRNGVPIYRKSTTGRHAGPGEIIQLLRTTPEAATS